MKAMENEYPEKKDPGHLAFPESRGKNEGLLPKPLIGVRGEGGKRKL